MFYLSDMGNKKCNNDLWVSKWFYSKDNLVIIKKENKKIKTVEGEKQVIYNLHMTFFSNPLNHSFPFKGTWSKCSFRMTSKIKVNLIQHSIAYC